MCVLVVAMPQPTRGKQSSAYMWVSSVVLLPVPLFAMNKGELSIGVYRDLLAGDWSLGDALKCLPSLSPFNC